MEEHVEEATGQVTRKPVTKTRRKRKREVTETEEPPAIVAKIDKSPLNKKVTFKHHLFINYTIISLSLYK